MNRLFLAALLCSACFDLPLRPDGGAIGGGWGGIGGGLPGTGGGNGGTGGGVASSTPPLINIAVFAAVGAGATRLLADVANARIELDPTQRDALTALGECADLVSYCYAPGSVSVSQCFARARTCASTEPWNEQACCPSDCKAAFDAEVALGRGHVQALEKVLFREPDCFPGARAALEAP